MHLASPNQASSNLGSRRRRPQAPRTLTLERVLHTSHHADEEPAAAQEAARQSLEQLYISSTAHAMPARATTPALTHAVRPGKPSIRAQRQHAGTPAARRHSALGRARAGPVPPQAGSSSAGAQPDGPLDAVHAAQLQAVMHLWQLHVRHEARQAMLHRDRPPRLLDSGGPRVLTAKEEQLLGGIIQEHARLRQLYEQHPQLAHSTDPLFTSSSSSSSSLGLPGLQDNISSSSFECLGGGASPVASPSSSGSSTAKRRHHNAKAAPPLAPDEVSQLVALSRQWRALLPALAARAQQLLVVYNLRLISHMVQYLPSNSLPLEDLHAAGLAGLQIAAARLQPDKGRFSTIACLWILQAMQRELVRSASISRPPKHHAILAHVQSVYGRAVAADIARWPNVVQQVAETFGCRPATIIKAVQGTAQLLHPLSLESGAFNSANNPKADGPAPTFAAMLTSTDLDEPCDGEGGSGADMAGQGSFLAAAGQVPGWVLAQRPQHPSEESSTDAVAGRSAEQQMQQWMAVLNGRERQFITLMYGQQGCGALAAALQADELPSNSRGPRRGSTSSSSSSSSRPPTPQPRQRLFPLGNVRMVDAASQLGYTSVEALRLVRATAFDKLRAVAAAGDAAAAGMPAAVPQAAVTAQPAAIVPAAAAAEGQRRGSTAGAAAVLGRLEARRRRAAAARAIAPRSQQLMSLLRRFVAEHGRPPAPSEKQDGVAVGTWLARQCRKARAGTISQGLAAAIEDVLPASWDWRVPPPPDAPAAAEADRLFLSYMALVRGFQAAQGRLPASRGDVWRGVAVGRWLQQQRMLAAQSLLPARHEALLQSLPGWHESSVAGSAEPSSRGKPSSSSSRGKPSSSSSSSSSSGSRIRSGRPRLSSRRDNAFESQLQRLQQYVAQHGRPPVPSDTAAGSGAVYQWCTFVRATHKQGALAPEQVAALEVLPNWTWDAWQFCCAALQDFVRLQGRLPGRADVHWGKWVGRWAARQQAARRKGLLGEQQLAALEAVPGWAWVDDGRRA